MQKSTENVLVSPKYRTLQGNRDQGIEWWCQNFNRKFINSSSWACAVKIWLKIALNAVRLPKFEPVNGISSPRKIMVKDLRQRSGLAWFCARAESCVVFNTGPYTVLPDNSILITANMQSETGFPSGHQLKSYVASKSRLKLAARCPVSGCWPSCFCLSCAVCPVCDVGALWPNGGMNQDETWQAGRPRPWPHCVRWGPRSPSPKGAQPPIFGPYLLLPNGWMHQDATW